MPPTNLEKEAVKITEELGKVAFVGAFAVNHYVEFRATRDIDLVVGGQLDEGRLRELGYTKREGSRNSWYTPRGIQADFYTRDVGRIPVEWVLDNAVPVRVGKKKISIISLEGLIIAKHRAGRSQDVADLRRLVANRAKDIDWDVMSELGTDLEIEELRQVARATGG